MRLFALAGLQISQSLYKYRTNVFDIGSPGALAPV
jgi:hypothetical protein